jgi:hypothetical protein
MKELLPTDPPGLKGKETRSLLIVIAILVMLFVGGNKIFNQNKQPELEVPKVIIINRGIYDTDTIDISDWDTTRMDSFVNAIDRPRTREGDSLYKVYKLDELDSLMNLPNSPSEDSFLLRQKESLSQ